MNPNDIIQLLDSGKKDEAKKKLIEYLETVKLSPEDTAKAYADFASLYSKVHNEVLAKYHDFLGEFIDELKMFNEKTHAGKTAEH